MMDNMYCFRKSSPTRSHLLFLDESWFCQFCKNATFSIWLLLPFLLCHEINQCFVEKRKLKFLPHAQKHADLCAFPPYVSNFKLYSLNTCYFYQNALFSDGWFEFWCPKAELSLCEYRTLEFLSSHLEKPFLLLILQVSSCFLTSVKPPGSHFASTMRGTVMVDSLHNSKPCIYFSSLQSWLFTLA